MLTNKGVRQKIIKTILDSDALIIDNMHVVFGSIQPDEEFWFDFEDAIGDIIQFDILCKPRIKGKSFFLTSNGEEYEITPLFTKTLNT